MKYPYPCHKIKIKNCKGKLLSSREKYAAWAYWCSNQTVKGWRPVPCTCKTNTEEKE